MPISGGDDASIEERVARLETALAEILAKSRVTSPVSTGPGSRSGPPEAPPSLRPDAAQPPRAFVARSAEWWLARGGALLTCLAVVLLYQYAVERSWITPLIRVLLGTAVGAGLIIAGFRTTTEKPGPGSDSVGLREALMGAGLSAWYISAYAAALVYHLIPMGTGRLLFLVLSISGVWLALAEKRALLALLALSAGFFAPSLLPSPDPSIPAFAIYLGTLTAIGLVVYLMRGWQSVAWLTSIAFWWTAGEATSLISRSTESITAARLAMTILIAGAGLAMVRVPMLRRRLLATGSDLYTEPVRSRETRASLAQFARNVGRMTAFPASADSAAVWLITLGSPPLAVLLLSWVWTGVDSAVWGLATIASAAVAYGLTSSSSAREEEFAHVEATAVALWSAIGIVWIANALASPRFPSGAIALALLSAYGFASLHVMRNSLFEAARRVVLGTAAAMLVIVLGSEAMFANFRNSWDVPWTTGEIAVIALCGWIWWIRRRPGHGWSFAKALAAGAWLALMLVDARILGRLWQPLVTTSYAIAGTALLVLAKRSFDPPLVRRVGGLTLVVVVIRLLLVDLARVEAIWRVLLFLLCGALFLYASHRLQSARNEPSAEPSA